MDLTLDEIKKLLSDDTPSKPHLHKNSLYHPVQTGPLRWFEPPGGRCASRGCSSPTLLKVNGIWYCATHALYILNELMLPQNIIEGCTCETGKHTKHNIHNSFCALYKELREERDNGISE